MRRKPVYLALILACSFGLPAAVLADRAHAHEAGEHHEHDGHDHAAAAEHSHEGQKGGVVADAGKYHAELVVDGTPNVTVYLSGHDYSEVAAVGFKGTAIFLVDGKSHRFELKPADGSRLVGTAPAPIEKGVKGVVQLIGPDGESAQAKF
jgi:hypothetical protein